MFKRGLFFLAGIVFSTFPAMPLEWRFTPTDSSALLPEGWQIHDNTEPGRGSFINPEGSIIFQISVYPGEAYTSDLEMMDSHLEELEIIESDYSRFQYRDGTVSLSDSKFLSSGAIIRGWFLFIDREDYDYYLAGITPEELYEESLPWILSCLDSFSPDEIGRNQSGAISSLLSSGGGDKESSLVNFHGHEFGFEYEAGREDAAQVLIEREAAILSSYRDPVDFASAWKRYYQLIYRDTAMDMEMLASSLSPYLEGKSDPEKASAVLDWLQGFQYGSSDSFSDLLAPVTVISKEEGDCDALGLVYCHLMNKLGIPSLLMVSYIYSHSMAAVGIDQAGAGFSYDGKGYIVAEMTKKVDIGMISQDMADMNHWIVISPRVPDRQNFPIVMEE